MLSNPLPSSGEFSLRDLVGHVRDYSRELLRQWKILAIFALVMAGYMAYKYFKYTPVYPATITFNVDEDEGGSSSGLTGLLGQFGIAGVKPARYNLDKILALSKSRRVIQQSLFAKVVIDGKNDYLANHVIRIYKLNANSGGSKKSSPEFYFTQDSLDLFSEKENQMLLAVYGFIIGPPNEPKKALLKADYNEDTNIMSLSVTTINETLSLELASHLFDALSKYYIDKSVEKLMKTYKLVSAKKDSVLAVLKGAEYALANFRDTHRGLLMRTDQITELRLQREIAALTVMYTEVLKNTEVTDFSVKNKTPFVQTIDTPMSPIAPVQLSLIVQLIKGGLLGLIIGGVFVIGRKIIRNALSTS